MDAVTALPSRHVACDNAFNVRDLGGYRTVDDRSLRWRTLFRADGLHRIVGGEALVELGWRTVIDLRTLAETTLGSFAADGVDVVHLPVLQETWENIAPVDDGNHVRFLVDRYLEMLDEGAPAYAAAVEIMAARDRLPAVFHCSAGKDRTGVLAALVLDVLGVPDHQIAADYHLSALAMDQLVAWLVDNRPDLVDTMPGPSGRLSGRHEQPKHFLACPPEAMLELLDRLRSRFGSAASYLIGAGVQPSSLSSLRDLLLEP